MIALLTCSEDRIVKISPGIVLYAPTGLLPRRFFFEQFPPPDVPMVWAVPRDPGRESVCQADKGTTWAGLGSCLGRRRLQLASDSACVPRSLLHMRLATMR